MYEDIFFDKNSSSGRSLKKSESIFLSGILRTILLTGIVVLLGVAFIQQEKKGKEECKEFTEITEKALPADTTGETVSKDVEIAFTFDDGPHPVWTEKLLDGLKARGIRATFFVIGQSAEEYPELIQRMISDGNQVGNHTYSHVQLTACGMDQAIEEIKKTQEAIYQAAGFSPEYIRPPFGSWNETLQNETSLETVLWDVDPYDWKVQNTDAIVKSILNQTEDGSIILLHDVYETSVEAALKAADIFIERGYRFCTVDEIMIE